MYEVSGKGKGAAMKRDGVGEGEGEQLPVGRVESSGGDDEESVLAAELWIPDPEEWRGWRVYAVWKKKNRHNGPAGFRRSRGKGDG
mgnify:CR=1 FL=1